MSDLLLLGCYALGVAQGAWFSWWWFRGRHLKDKITITEATGDVTVAIPIWKSVRPTLPWPKP